jgi:hypothetical protein
LVAHHSFHCGDNLILFGLVLDFRHSNQRWQSEYGPDPGST